MRLIDSDELKYDLGLLFDAIGARAYGYVLGTIDGLPTIDPVKYGEWIPITARPMTTDERTKRSEELGYDVEYEDDESVVYTSALPDENEPVLVTREFSCGKRQKRYVEIADRIGNSWFSYSDEYKVGNHGRPIAWMPLPEPYKEKDDEAD